MISHRSRPLRSVLGLLLVFGLVLAACSAPAPTAKPGGATETGKAASTGGAASTGPIKIGWIGPLSGSLASYGNENKAGIEFAVERINANGGIKGQQIEVVFVDSKFDAALATQAAQRMATEDRVTAIIGDISSAVTVALVDTTRRLKVPQVAALAGTPKITQMGSTYIFRPYPSVINTYTALANYATSKLGYKKFAFIAYNDEGGVSSMQTFLDALRATKMGETTATEVVPVDAKEFRGTLTKIRETSPDAVVIAAAAPVSGLIVKQAREMGWNVPFLGHGGYQALKEFRETAGPAGDSFLLIGTYDPTLYTYPEAQAFVKDWKAKFNADPTDMNAHGYDQISMIAAVIEQVGNDREKVREGLSELKDWPGAAGKYTFLPNGDVDKDLVVLQWKDAKLVPIEVYSKPAQQ